MQHVLISYDLPAAPAEDAFKQAARQFNAAFAKLSHASSSTGIGMFLVLREACSSDAGQAAVSFDAKQGVVLIDCPLRAHMLEPNTNSVLTSLAATLASAVQTADAYCKQNAISFDAQAIRQLIAAVALEAT
jgi:hypothetical protein